MYKNHHLIQLLMCIYVYLINLDSISNTFFLFGYCMFIIINNLINIYIYINIYLLKWKYLDKYIDKN